MLTCEQYAEEVSQEAEGLKNSAELSPNLQWLHSSHVKVSGLSLLSEISQTPQQPASGP